MLYIKQIMSLLKIDQETAILVESFMAQRGADFSEMTQSQFNRMAREVLKDFLSNTI